MIVLYNPVSSAGRRKVGRSEVQAGGHAAKSKLLLALGSVVFVLLIGELVARLAYRPDPVIRVYDPFAYRIPQPGLVAEFHGEKRPVVVRLNELGMRGPALASSADAELTLVFLGGSTTENYSLSPPQTFPEMVGATLRRRLDRSMRVFNGGASAATSAVSLGRLQHQVLDLRPSLVVVMHGINDLLRGFHPAYRADSRHLPRPPPAGTRPLSYLRSWILKRSLRGEPPLPAVRHTRRRLLGPEEFPPLPAFQRNLRSIAAVLAAHEIPLLLLTQPTMYELEEAERQFHLRNRLEAGGLPLPDFESLSLGMELFNDEVRALEGVYGTRVLDLSSRLPRSWTLFQDECHFTAAGNAEVAQQIAPQVEQILRAEP
ncbi:MAG: SGNH/GDSL hydrolase family protein [Planctomycetota bacterium]|jgi:lysophospholipase L1-like esterase